VWIFSPARHLLFVNDAQEALSGRSKEKLYANPNSYLELIHPDDSEHVEKILQARQYGESYAMNYRILRDDGEIRYVRELGKSICDTNGNLLYHITSAMDISSELLVRDELHELNSRLREANLRLRESVRLDGLTRCLNRTALFDEAEKALLLERRYERSSTLVFFDLNNFKEVNDNFGHHVGDRGLIAFAEQIKARLRTTDELGRYGGDEFVALLRETDADQAMQLLATLPPVVVDDENGSSIILRFSAGVACSSEPDIDTVDDWLRIADGQMYNQKVRFLKENGGRG
jgi:diguanylate cyclase (GGDEF)-like protein/PAS domain S-box-containing protein